MATNVAFHAASTFSFSAFPPFFFSLNYIVGNKKSVKKHSNSQCHIFLWTRSDLNRIHTTLILDNYSTLSFYAWVKFVTVSTRKPWTFHFFLVNFFFPCWIDTRCIRNPVKFAYLNNNQVNCTQMKCFTAP